jgi:probable rRNA maturation factor
MRAATRALSHERDGEEPDLTLRLTDDEQMQALNNQYRGVDSSTDVLAFPSGEADPDSGSVYLGDVVISVPRAASQAQVGGHSLEAELQLLVVHGVLHLLGYDHASDDDKALMWGVQAEILTAIGCPIDAPTI